jgi:hypothetical protein
MCIVHVGYDLRNVKRELLVRWLDWLPHDDA